MTIETTTLERLLREPSPDAWRLVIERAIAIASSQERNSKRGGQSARCAAVQAQTAG